MTGLDPVVYSEVAIGDRAESDLVIALSGAHERAAGDRQKLFQLAQIATHGFRSAGSALWPDAPT